MFDVLILEEMNWLRGLRTDCISQLEVCVITDISILHSVRWIVVTEIG